MDGNIEGYVSTYVQYVDTYVHTHISYDIRLYVFILIHIYHDTYCTVRMFSQRYRYTYV